MRPKIWLRTPSGGAIQLCGSLSRFCAQQNLDCNEMLALLNQPPGEAGDHMGWRAGYGQLPPPEAAPKRRSQEPPAGRLVKARSDLSQPYRAVRFESGATEDAQAREIKRKLGARKGDQVKVVTCPQVAL